MTADARAALAELLAALRACEPFDFEMCHEAMTGRLPMPYGATPEAKRLHAALVAADALAGEGEG